MNSLNLKKFLKIGWQEGLINRRRYHDFCEASFEIWPPSWLA